MGAVQTIVAGVVGGFSSTCEPGTIVAGRYKIVRALGQGGMASVYLAEDLVLGKTEVAIKILKRRTKDSEQELLVERFIREVQLTHRINHQHVVRTFDFGCDGSTIFYTMEYLPGVSLDRMIKQGGLDVATVKRFAGQLLSGLAAIHSVGVVHRDLKPENIILSDIGNLKVTDFGIARSNSSKNTALSSELLGTVSYIAPEVIRGVVATRAADYYALGVILYELLTGDTPFYADNPARMILRKLDDKVPSVKLLRGDTPEWLADAIEGLLDKNPSVRERAVQKLATFCSTGSVVSETSLQDATHDHGRWSGFDVRSAFRRTAIYLKANRSSALWIQLLFIILSALIAIPLSTTQLGRKIELDYLDMLFQMRGTRAPHPDVMVVAIDEQSYSHLNVPLTSSWPRALHAKLVNTLAEVGAKRVVFDVLFTAAEQENPVDQDFAAAMARVPTVLGAALGFSQKTTFNGTFLLEELLQPAPLFERESVGMGVVGLPQQNGRIRSFFESRSEVFPNVSSLAEMAVLLDRTSSYRPKRDDLINFYGPSKTIPTVSYEMVVTNSEGEVLRQIFRDKIVFVGLGLKSSTGPSQRDAFITPYDASTYGTEIHATAASNLLQNDWVQQPSVVTRQLIVACVASALALPLVFCSGATAILTLVAVLVVTVGIQYVLFLFNTFIPIVSGLAWGAVAGALVRIVVVPTGERSQWVE